MFKIEVSYTSENENFVPSYKTEGAAGFDVFANESVWILPGGWKKIKTGWKFSIPEGYFLMVCSRSGNAVNRGLISHIAPGIIDSDYRGECFACVRNVSFLPRKIKKGDRVLQFVLVPVVTANFVKKDELDSTTRGSAGFGSTGN